MKTSIIYLGIAMMIVTSSIATNRNLKNVTSTRTEYISTEIEQGDAYKADLKEKIKFAPVEDQALFYPESTLNVNYQKNIEYVILEDTKITESQFEKECTFIVEEKAIEEVIFEDNQITESGSTTEVYPLYLERTMEETITENNAIIESSVNAVAQPIDFEIVNKVTTVLKKDTLLF